jgi:hypothetical protein
LFEAARLLHGGSQGIGYASQKVYPCEYTAPSARLSQ